MRGHQGGKRGEGTGVPGRDAPTIGKQEEVHWVVKNPGAIRN